MFFNYILFLKQLFPFNKGTAPGGKTTDGGSGSSLFHTGPRRIRFLVFFFLLFPLLWVSTMAGFLADHILFPGFRRQKTEKPVFILGNFRSGTTLLQRLLARDSGNFSAIRSWEIYTAPSISQRRFIQGAAMIDRVFGSPVLKSLKKFEKKVLGQVEIHKVGIWEPEEDEGLFFFVWYSLFIWFFFPGHIETMRFDRFDQTVPSARKKRIMSFYRNCIKRHLYAHTGKKTGAIPVQYLSKNPSHTGRIRSLLEEFPEARIIYLYREPEQVLSSTASWFGFCWNFFCDPAVPYPLTGHVLDLTRHFYAYPLSLSPSILGSSCLWISYEELTRDLQGTVEKIYNRFEIPLTEEFRASLRSEQKRSRRFSSSHRYTLHEQGIAAESVRTVLQPLYRQFRNRNEKKDNH